MVGRISFFVNAGIKFVTELAKMRAFTELWDEITRDRYGVEDEKLRRFRYGVQVNSLGLTSSSLRTTSIASHRDDGGGAFQKRACARRSAAGVERGDGTARPWDQQWSLRMQQIVAFETDLLENDDIFDGSVVISGRSRR